MTVLRILLFSLLAALVLYHPFYYFAPIYRECYVHVPEEQLNWWVRYWFKPPHSGTQVYIAYVLMFAVIGLTVLFEYTYFRFIKPSYRWIALATAAIGGAFYLHSIGFNPPRADVLLNDQADYFIWFSMGIALIAGLFYRRKEMECALVILLIAICMIPPVLSFMATDYFYLLAPALRTIHGFLLNQSYFQYDYLLSFLGMAWMKLGLPIDRFYICADLSNLVFFIGIYFFAKKFFLNSRLAVYFIISLVIIKVYGNVGDTSLCPQVCALRLDQWLLILAIAYWKGTQHWLVGVCLAFFVIFHHTFGMIYSVAYLFLFFSVMTFNLLVNLKRSTEIIKEGIGLYFINFCIVLMGFVIYQIFISSNKTIPGLNYTKYNVGFMPIEPASFFWYAPVLVSMVFLLLWKGRKQLHQKYLQAGIFLVFLVIGNLIYFFGRSHENNLINIAASLWLIFFMLIDLIVCRLPQRILEVARRTFIPVFGVMIVGLSAYFYCNQAVCRIKLQLDNVPKLGDLFKPDQQGDLNMAEVKAVTRGNPNIIFLSTNHDLEYYYLGGYVPPDICPLSGQFFMKDLATALHQKLEEGADIIVPEDEFKPLIEMILIESPKYQYDYKGFVYLSNNAPAF